MDRRRFSSAVVAPLFVFTGWLLPFSLAGCSKGIDIPTGVDYSDWPDLFRLTAPYPEDPTASNRDEDAGPVDPSVLFSAGVVYKHFDPAGYDYPNRTKEIPWFPPANGTNDADLQLFREDQDYQYADIVVLTSYMSKFYVEHLHAGGDEVRYVVDGSGYFDIRDVNDEWVRMHARAGDLVEFPTGIEHRFSVDDDEYIQAMRLFPGSGAPDWSSVHREDVHGNNTSRNDYVEKYLCGVDPDLEDDGDHSDDNHSHDDEEDLEFDLLGSTSSSLAVFSSAPLFVVAGIIGAVLF